MRGLTLILVEDSPARFDAALMLAAAQAALGGRTRLFLQGGAVSALARPLPALVEEAIALGVELIACQTGLADAGLSAANLDPRITCAGPVSLLQTLGEDRMVVV